MVDYIEILNRKQQLLLYIELSLRDADNNREKESSSVTIIQKVFRGERVRTDITLKSIKAIIIERIYRGHLGRRKALNEIKSIETNQQISLFQYFTIQIQRLYRGYYSRKYRFNFAKRKREIKEIADKGEQVRHLMEKYFREQQERELKESEEKKLKEIQLCSENLHHLVSTKHIRGVLNPNMKYMDLPLIGNVPAEEHIRAVVKDLLKSRGITKTGLITDLNGNKRIPLKGLQNHLSIQASTPYYAMDEIKKKERLDERLIAKDKGNYFAGGRTKILESNLPPAMTQNDPYVDSWANPMTIRGVPENQTQLLQSAYLRKPLFITKPSQPFVSSIGGNKSTVLPNDLFDVIADAEETGGAVHRNLGKSIRFGVSNNSDNRPEGGPIPAPPTRVKTIKSIMKLHRHTNSSNNRSLSFVDNKLSFHSNSNDDSSSDEDVQ